MWVYTDSAWLQIKWFVWWLKYMFGCFLVCVLTPGKDNRSNIMTSGWCLGDNANIFEWTI